MPFGEESGSAGVRAAEGAMGLGRTGNQNIEYQGINSKENNGEKQTTEDGGFFQGADFFQSGLHGFRFRIG